MLNEICNPLTLAFIETHIDLKNKSILDIGCGIRILACEFAKKSLPCGQVLAMDISQAQLDIAKRIAEQNNLFNMAFEKRSILDIDQINKPFDLIYCRFVLAHVSFLEDIIQKIIPLMHGQITFICEEPNSIHILRYEPYNAIFEQFKKAVIQKVNISKVDFAIGKKLAAIFEKNHLKIAQETFQEPCLDTPDLKNQL